MRLQLNANIKLGEHESILLRIINEVYIDSRYPGDLGLLPNGKPTIKEAETFLEFCDSLYYRITNQIS